MDFDVLIGKGTLSGFDTGSEKIKMNEWSDELTDCDVAVFTLSGQTFLAVEDPSDGYRSSMFKFEKTRRKVKNSFDLVDVFCRHREIGAYSGKDDVLEIYNLNTGKLILEIGVSNIDDYYPSWVCNWTPENIGEKK